MRSQTKQSYMEREDTSLQLGPLSKELPLKIKIPNEKIGTSIVPFIYLFLVTKKNALQGEKHNQSSPEQQGTINHQRQDSGREFLPSSMAPFCLRKEWVSQAPILFVIRILNILSV